jgi:hypothetical protein
MAALGSRVLSYCSLTHVSCYSNYPPPITTPPTHAVLAAVDLQVLRRADTGVVPQGVVACARGTDAWVHRAFIDICRGGGLASVSSACPSNSRSQTQQLLLYRLRFGFKISLKLYRHFSDMECYHRV